jgi:hypothetical protein
MKKTSQKNYENMKDEFRKKAMIKQRIKQRRKERKVKSLITC